ncbi:MAG TPA: preprotein translocase subunit SecA [Candidatus Avoscillospira stercoripullorum]|uniref:Protein translocase subunit SecA n=1 Tax=Candidatus Avoscillospira stercoripullorum TaxID=2840709 RepID=A0A9D1D6H8_9FIRM|nr:preprotein translocase subunit SecA [Candidatus Avoscillospira stercoripullorum]
MGLINKLFGTRSQREIKKFMPQVDAVMALEDEYRQLSDEALKAKTADFKARLQNGETLDDILVEAFATCREAADRVLGMRPYRVQVIGGIVLHQGRIAEMKTGEGKTLVAILPAYLNALSGKGVHIVTVNDYLAKRDSEWMGKVYRYLGLSVGLIIHGLTAAQRREAYAADITYCTNNELGFDYLRDNMAIYKQEMVQRGHNFVIVDEVDSILIDEARTPLIISGQGEASTKLYEMADFFVSRLKKMVFASTDEKEEQDQYDCDYIVDEKARTVSLTAKGIAKAEEYFQVENLSDPENTTLAHHINQAMKARGLMKRDIDYVVKDGQVIIVDEFTGRLMYGRRYNEGLHQAIEAKEGVTVANESKTLATITFQNFFRLYAKLSGMTGTALTEAEEFMGIYDLDVIEIPTNKPVARIDHPDVVYKTEAGKFRAVIRQIKECHAKGQPVLVGTISIEKSEILSKMLKKEGVPHNVLNAKHHEKEAEIVAQAGKLGAVTIATNMAGRGTDIMLGGNAEYLALNDLRKSGMAEELIVEANAYSETENPEILAARRAYQEAYEKHKAEISKEAEQVRAAGGLFIVGTERHESRRIDNQLRGRAGRQGDPGETRFYLSLEDDVMRLFGSDRIKGMMETMGLDEDTPIDAKILSGAIENAQKNVESRNYQTRKNVLEYDDVMNTQRKVIYGQRSQVLEGEDLQSQVVHMMEVVAESNVNAAFGEQAHISRSDFLSLLSHFDGICFPKGAWSYTDEVLSTLTKEQAAADLLAIMKTYYQKKEAALTSPVMRELERVVTLRVVDEYWMDHLDAMTDLRQGIGLRAYGQNNPVVEYKREGYEMFENMIDSIREEIVRRMFLVQVKPQTEIKREKVAKVTSEGGAGDKTVKRQPQVRKAKVGRNDPCPCGSGKKYKNCCLDKDLAGK